MAQLSIPKDKLEELIQFVSKIRKNRVQFLEYTQKGLDLAWLNIALKELKYFKENI
jgi:hypothetical protein